MWMRTLQEFVRTADKDADEGAVKGTLGNRQYYSPALLLDWAPQIPEPRRTEISNRKSAPFCVATKSATQIVDLQRKVQRNFLRCTCTANAQFSEADSRSPVGTTSTGQAACAKMDCEVDPISAPANPPPPRVPTTTRSTAVENSVSNAAGLPSKA